MPRNTCFLLAVLMTALLLLPGCGGGAAGSGSGQQPALVTVKVLDIGQGDAILVRTAEQTALIDTGDVGTRDRLIRYIKNENLQRIDKLIVTHPHADHLGGAAAVLETFAVGKVIDSGQLTGTQLFRTYLATVKRKGIPFQAAAAGDSIDLGAGVTLRVLSAGKRGGEAESDLNNGAIVLRLEAGTFSMLLASDAEQEVESALVKKDAGALKSTVLKSGHHGSRSSSSAAFLKAVAPEAVVISVGAGNDYHHPHPSVMRRYEAAKTAIYRTDLHGTVTIRSDGKTYSIGKER